MRILYISQYFPPEAGATQTRAYEMARNWVRLGHQVTMLAEFPNHPSGVIPPSYRGKLFERDQLDGIEVVRVWVKASLEKNYRNRILFYLTFMFSAILAGIILTRGKYDLLYASSPPLFVGGTALFFRFLKRIPLVFEVRDLWPESAVALGELSNQRVISLASRLEQACYRRAARVVVVTQGIHDRLVDRGIPVEKLILIPNGANIDLFTFRPIARERVRQELGLADKFIAVYAGIHGLAQGLETVIDAASELQDDLRFHFLLIGDGPKKAELMNYAASRHITNLAFLPERPREEIPDYLSAADVALVPLKKAEIFKGALPSKIFDAWSCERPVLLSIDGEARSVVERVRGGYFIPPEDGYEMVKALSLMQDSPDVRLVMGKNGRKYTIENHSRAALAENLAHQLERLIQS